METVWNWIINSSKDPQKLSLTVKGMIGFLAIFGIDSTVLGGVENSVVDIVVEIGMLGTSLLTFYGFGRKIYITFLKKSEL